MKLSKALVVDDSKVVRIKLGRLLETRGLIVDSADSGEEALDYLKTNNAPDIIFMDFMMPDMDGYQVTGIITKDPATASIPVIICTGQDTPDDRVRAKENGARGFLTKPIEDGALDKLLAEFVSPSDMIEIPGEAPDALNIPVPTITLDPVVLPELTIVPELPATTAVPAYLSAEETARIAEQAARDMAEKIVQEAIAAASAAAQEASREAARSAAESAVQNALNAWREESIKMQQESEQRAIAAAERIAQGAAKQVIDANQFFDESTDTNNAPSIEDTIQAARQAAQEMLDNERSQTSDATRSAAENAVRDALASAMENIIETASRQAASQIDVEGIAAAAAENVVSQKLQQVTEEASKAGREAAVFAMEESMQSMPQNNNQDIDEVVQTAVMSAQEEANESMSEFVESKIGAAVEQVEYSNAWLLKITMPWLIGLTLAILFVLYKVLMDR